ncbi:MAG: hypothetical protein IMX00_07755 [Limnochordales bacterium]|nr:hypothetical protein [Limnochordales bacterium]
MVPENSHVRKQDEGQAQAQAQAQAQRQVEAQAQSRAATNDDLWQAVERILARSMTPQELQALREFAGVGGKRRSELPFQYDPDSGRFEIGDAWLVDLAEWEELGADLPPGSPLMELLGETALDSAVDLLCRACDILTENQSELDLDLFRRPEEGGSFTFTFRFTLGEDQQETGGRDEKTARLFESLLAEASRGGGPGSRWQVETQTKDGERIVRVTVTYRSDQEFGAQRDHLYWLLDLAERRRYNRPFEAKRIW